ncbi:transmembrane transporter, putative, partial [Perkinsus marinus ATCC 50983]
MNEATDGTRPRHSSGVSAMFSVGVTPTNNVTDFPTAASSTTSATSDSPLSSRHSSIAASLATSGGLTRRPSRVATISGMKRSTSSTEDATAATASDRGGKVVESPDEGAEGSVPEPSGSILSLWTVLSKTMIGVGMLGLAYSVSRCGWVIGILAIIISGLASLFTLHLLNRCALMLEVRPMSFFVISQACSPRSRWVVDTILVITSIGVCIVYLQVVGNMLEPLISRWIPIIPETIGSFATRAILILICVAIVSPVCFWRSAGNTAIVNMVGLISLVYVVILGIVYCDCSKTDENTTVWPPANFWTVMGVLPIIIMSFGCHMNAFLVTDDLKNRTQKRVDIVSTAAISTAIVIFIPAMVFPYITFGYDVEALSLQNLSVNYIPVQIGYVALAVSE